MSLRALIVGDMHVVPEELGDCSAVLALILETCLSEGVSEVIFLGDQHHTHSIVNVEVMHWWRVAFHALRAEGIKSTCLVGNHDQVSPGSNVHALLAYKDLPHVQVIDAPLLRQGILFIPYVHDEAEFQSICEKHQDHHRGANTVICHATFNGANYENGFLASDGFNPGIIPQELVISGHIHSPQEFSKVWYPGAPRWRTLADANVDRSVWLVEFDERGRLKSRTPFDTGTVCRQIRHLVDSPSDPVSLPLDTRHSWRIDIRGPADWCQARKVELSAAGARVRTFPDQVQVLGRVRESDGIDQAFAKYVGLFKAPNGTAAEALTAMAKERGLV
jgi:hypothetical protein